MQYYTLTHAVDTDETGPAFPQADFSNPKKLSPQPVLTANKARNGSYPPDDMPPFDYLELNKGAKLTDLMSSPFENGFLISEKLKQLFIESNITDYKIYDVALLDTKHKLIDGYFYFHSASCLRDFIDYPKSKFCVAEITDKIKYYLPTVQCYDELAEFKKNTDLTDLILSKQLYLKSNFPFNLDLFRLYTYNYDFFITEQLKQKLEKNNITGIEVKSAANFIKTPYLA